MPNQLAVPLVPSPRDGTRHERPATSLPAHEQAARRRRRESEAPRHGTVRSPQTRHQPRRQPQQLPLNPFPAPGPVWVGKPLNGA